MGVLLKRHFLSLLFLKEKCIFIWNSVSWSVFHEAFIVCPVKQRTLFPKIWKWLCCTFLRYTDIVCVPLLKTMRSPKKTFSLASPSHILPENLFSCTRSIDINVSVNILILRAFFEKYRLRIGNSDSDLFGFLILGLENCTRKKNYCTSHNQIVEFSSLFVFILYHFQRSNTVTTWKYLPLL